MDEKNSSQRVGDLTDQLASMERRLAKVELVLGMHEQSGQRTPKAKQQRDSKELELAVGQHLFAKVGVVVLAIGGMLTLLLPWQGLPPLAPSVAGWVAAVGLFALAQLLQKRMPLDARYFRGSAMALLFFAALRLCHFAEKPYFDPQSLAAAALLAVVVVVNLAVAYRRKSVFLTGIALFTGFIAALAVGTAGYVLVMIAAMLVWGSLESRRRGWVGLPLILIPLAWLCYLMWAIGNPLIGHSISVVTGPVAAVVMLMVWLLFNALMSAFRIQPSEAGMELQVASLFNCGGYVLFLLHTLIAFRDSFAIANIGASVLLLGLAAVFWLREKSHFATFLYAMTGYTALTAALISLSDVPELFAWLSAQSLLVVLTAIWFRSRLIIVANFLIYLAVMSTYMVLVDVESGMSLIFVLVALTSSRALKIHKDRLELKTEMMRNAYLASAFVVFPYALYHMVPSAWVAASWVGIAVFYYVMNMLTQAHKYRWMGHNTLLLTVAYIVMRSIGEMEETQRVMSFLLLGAVMLVVSLMFTMLHARQQRDKGPSDEGPQD